jgi:LPXTG-motif cell wall-anchored protein
MSLTRRLAAGLPAVGVTVFAALAFAGSPANAAPDVAGAAARPVTMTTPCAAAERTKCGYNDADVPDDNSTSPSSAGDDNGTGAGDNDDDRGNPGYGGVSPSTSPATPTPTTSTPTGNTDTVPPGGVSPTTASPSTPTGGGVSPAGTLPLTGAPMGATVALGALMVAIGGFAVWYSRRRRNA